MFVLGGTGEVEFDIKRGNSGVLARFGLFLTDISRFPQAGVLRLDLQANANDGKASLAAYLSRYLCQVKRHHVYVVPFHLAGETRFEHATYGFGDRYSTVEPLPYQALLFYYFFLFKSIILYVFSAFI